MGLISLLIILLIAAVCGAIGTAIVGVDKKGCLTNMVIGLIGAMLGRWMSMQLDIRDIFYYRSIPILWTIIGSAVFILGINLLIGHKRR